MPPQLAMSWSGTGPSGLLVSRALACARTMGSLSKYTTRDSGYTTRDSGAARWAPSWVLSADGRPVPMSGNCRIPASPTRYRTARPRNAGWARTLGRMVGYAAITCSAASRSAA